MVQIEGKKYSYEEIKQGNYNVLSSYSQSVLDFCKDWLNNEVEFTLQTSGSTGVPKEIVITRTQMKASAWMTINAFQLTSKDKALVVINTSYIGGKMMLVRSMEAHMDMTVVEATSNPLEYFPATTHFDFTALVPLQLETILTKAREKKKILDGMKAIVIGGAAVSNHLEQLIQDIQAPVYSTYAMTETVSHIALRRLNGKERSEYYTALPDVKLGISNKDTLTITSPVTDNKQIVTNDVVELINNTTFKWLGRADNVINSGGVKIFPEELETQIQFILTTLNISNRFFCFSKSHEQLGQAVSLIFEGESLTQETESLIKEKFNSILSKYSTPKQFFYSKKFIETATGKVNRSATISSLTNQ